jgi:hypothetical protein
VPANNLFSGDNLFTSAGMILDSRLPKRLADKRLRCLEQTLFNGPAQPSPTLGDALSAEYLYLEVKCLGCDTHQTVALRHCPAAEEDSHSRLSRAIIAGGRRCPEK